MATPKLKTRDLNAPDEEPYLTRSNAEIDLETRMENGNEVAGPVKSIQPNPLGEATDDGQYVGTDPIYQNSSTVANAPFDADDGVQQDIEAALKEEYDFDPEDEGVAPDAGTGGVAEVAGLPGGETFRTILPGQEGYDRDAAEEQAGPPLRVYGDDVVDDTSDEDEGSTPPPPPPPS